MKKINEIGVKDIELLKSFLSFLSKGKSKFRYFNKRPVSVIENHLLTILLLEDDLPIGYGHLDKDDEIIWLGIAVSDNHISKGNGTIIMNYLMDFAKKKRIEKITLSVDKDNLPAICMYRKMNFIKVQESSSYYIFEHICK